LSVAYSDTRYLLSKKTVDDRALNKDVVERLRGQLAPFGDKLLHVLEIGGGLGTMVARLIDWKVLRRASYVLLDAEDEFLSHGIDWLSAWARMRGHAIDEGPKGLRIGAAGGIEVDVTFLSRELGAYLAEKPADERRYDLLVANAFLDLVDVPSTLPLLMQRIAAGGLYWFSINFDGDTIFEPMHASDEALLAVYHRTMDERVRHGRPAGDSRTGRRLLRHLRAAGATVLAAGASDWIVFAEGAKYEGDEAYFLHHIVHTVEEALAERADVNQPILAEWAMARHGEIDRSELVYIAHQLDVLGRAPA
jgi:hypothetical protein